jgi:predicted RNase H-like HicB family nuclease
MRSGSMQYYVVYEHGEGGGWGAYLPDLPGCVALGETREEVRELIRGAIEMHLKGMREDGLPIPEPSAESGELVEVSAA